MAQAIALLPAACGAVHQSEDGRVALCLSFERRLLHVSDGRAVRDIPFGRIRGADLVRQHASKSRAVGGLSLKGAVLGSIVGGPAGMLVGGVSGKRRAETTTHLARLALEIIVDGPDGPAIESCVFYAGGSSLFGEQQEVAAEARALSALHDIEAAQAMARTPSPQRAEPPASPSPFTEEVAAVLADYGWRTRLAGPDVILGVRDDKRGVFACDGGAVSGLGGARGVFEAYPQANYRAVIARHALLPARQEAAELGVALFEIGDLMRRRPRVAVAG